MRCYPSEKERVIRKNYLGQQSRIRCSREFLARRGSNNLVLYEDTPFFLQNADYFTAPISSAAKLSLSVICAKMKKKINYPHNPHFFPQNSQRMIIKGKV